MVIELRLCGYSKKLERVQKQENLDIIQVYAKETLSVVSDLKFTRPDKVKRFLNIYLHFWIPSLENENVSRLITTKRTNKNKETY